MDLAASMVIVTKDPEGREDPEDDSDGGEKKKFTKKEAGIEIMLNLDWLLVVGKSLAK